MTRVDLAALGRAMPDSVRALNPHLFRRAGGVPSRRPPWLTDVEPLLTAAGAEVTLLLSGMRLPSAANLHELWTDRHARVRWQRRVVRDALARRSPPRLGGADGSCAVTFTRGAPRALDDDNLPAAFKAVRDAVAAWLGVDDSPRSPVRWIYAQTASPDSSRFVRVDLRPDTQEAP